MANDEFPMTNDQRMSNDERPLTLALSPEYGGEGRDRENAKMTVRKRRRANEWHLRHDRRHHSLRFMVPL